MSAQLPQVEVRLHKGRPLAFIEGQPHALAGFNTFGRAAFDRSMTLAYPHKMEVYFLQPEMPGPWPETRFWAGDQIDEHPVFPPGNFDLDAQAGHVLQGDPDAYLFVRFTVWPPASWTALHPQEGFVTETGVPLAHASLARHAGAHVYCESNDVLLADCSVVALHSLKSGEKRLSLPGVFRVCDLISGSEYAPATDEILFTLQAPETRVFLLEQQA